MVKTHKNRLALIMALALLFSTITSPLISYADETGLPERIFPTGIISIKHRFVL